MYNPFVFSSVAFRRRAYEALGGFRADDGWTYDQAFVIRVAARYPVDILPEPLVRYRRHPGQLTAQARWAAREHLNTARLTLRAARQLKLPPHLWVFPLLGWLYHQLPGPLRPRRGKEWAKHFLLRALGAENLYPSYEVRGQRSEVRGEPLTSDL
jgi:hypothetical protein